MESENKKVQDKTFCSFIEFIIFIPRSSGLFCDYACLWIWIHPPIRSDPYMTFLHIRGIINDK